VRAVGILLAAVVLLVTPATASSPLLQGRYGGHSADRKQEVTLGVLRDSHGNYEVRNFHIVDARGHGNTYFHSVHVVGHTHFRYFTPEGELDISGAWHGPGTINGHVFFSDGTGFHFTVYHRNEVL
jgi:hypothetical protein